MSNNLAWKYVKSNPRRSILTVLGISIALAMMMCIGNAISTILASSQKELVEMNGSWDAMFEGMDENASIESIKAEDKVDRVAGIYEKTNFAFPQLRPEGLTDNDWFAECSYTNYVSIDAGVTEMMRVNLKEGNMPANDSEAVISSSLAAALDVKVGGTIQPEVGDAIADYDNGYEDEDGNYIVPATFESETRLIKVCGIMDEEGNQGVFRWNDVIITGPKTSQPTVFLVKFQNGANVVTASEAVATTFNGAMEINEAVYTQSFSSIMSTMFMLGVVFIFCCCLIAFAAISIVRNSFSMSVTERMRDYGLLRCAGATQKQIKNLIRSEVLILLAIAFPLSLIISYIASAGVLAIVNNMDLLGMPKFDLTVSWFFVLLSLGIALLSMVIAVVGPSRKASRVSPIMITTGQDQVENIHNKAVAKKNRFGRIFGIEWDLASRNRKAAGKRSRTTIFSMTVSVTLLIATMGMMQNYLHPMLQENESEIDIQVHVYMNEDTGLYRMTEEDFEQYCADSQRINGVINSAKVREVYLDTWVDASMLRDAKAMEEIYGLTDNELYTNMRIKYIGRQEYEQLQQANSQLSDLSYDQWVQQGGGLLNDNVVSTQYNEFGRALKTVRHRLFNIENDGKLSAGVTADEVADSAVDEDSMTRSSIVEDVPQKQTLTLDINRLVSNRVWFDDTDNAAEYSVVYLPSERWQQDKDTYANIGSYTEFNFFAKTDPMQNEAVAEALETGNGGIYVGNLYRDELVTRNIILLISICVYSFVGVIALISCLNIINIIGTNLVMRKRDFGLLQAVGMNIRQMRKMIVFECIQFSLRSMLYGSILGFAALGALHMVITTNTMTDFNINPWSVLAIFAACFMVSVIASWPTWKKLKKVSIMESIRHMG